MDESITRKHDSMVGFVVEGEGRENYHGKPASGDGNGNGATDAIDQNLYKDGFEMTLVEDSSTPKIEADKQYKKTFTQAIGTTFTTRNKSKVKKLFSGESSFLEDTDSDSCVNAGKAFVPSYTEVHQKRVAITSKASSVSNIKSRKNQSKKMREDVNLFKNVDIT